MQKFLAQDRAETAYERALVRNNIPHEYWYQDFNTLPFTTVRFRHDQKLSSTQQRSGLLALCSDPRNQLAIIASTPEEPAMSAACCCLMMMLTNAMACGLVSADNPVLPKRYVEDARSLRALMVHNFLAHATPDRVQKVRDLMWRHRYVARVVVVTGTNDPYGFCVSKIGMRPTLVCLLKDQ